MATQETTTTRTKGAQPPTRPTRIGAALTTLLLAAVLTACGANQAVEGELDEIAGTMLVVTDPESGANHELAGSTVAGSIYVLVEAPSSVREVRFVLDDDEEPLKIDTSAPFDLELDTTGLAEGKHTIQALTPSGRNGKLRLLSTAEFTIQNAPDGTPPPGDPPPEEPTPEPDPGIVYGGPITITRGGTYSGNWQSLDRTVPAVLIKTSEPVVIENAFLRSAGHLIYAPWTGTNVTVRNVVGYGIAPTELGKTTGRFLAVEGFDRVVVENSYFESTMGIYLSAGAPGATVRVLRNQARNIDGRRSDGAGGYSGMKFAQFLQINAGVDLTHSEIAWNHVVNEPYLSLVEDVINFFDTSGTASDPIRVHHNYIQGAYAADPTTGSYSGGGILLGDAGGGYAHAYANHVVGTSNYGIGIAGGHHNQIYDNRVISCGFLPDGTTAIAAQNVGIVIWNPYDQADFGHNVGFGNEVAWAHPAHGRNDWWKPGAAEWYDNVRIDSGNTVSCSVERDELAVWQREVETANVLVGPAGGATIAAVRTDTATN